MNGSNRPTFLKTELGANKQVPEAYPIRSTVLYWLTSFLPFSLAYPKPKTFIIFPALIKIDLSFNERCLGW